MARVPEVGQRLLVVIVRCGCDDRWWAQPEGGYFPRCQQCGQEARPAGVPALAEREPDRLADHLARRRELAMGGILEVMMERDAMEVPRDA